MPPPKKNRATNQSAFQSTPNLAKDSSSWALKKTDGEMFTRADIQFDLMSAIFNDRTFQFTSPLDQRAVSFKELYIETLSKFSRAAKSTTRQLEENPTWATNFCIASFLINIGRINTTVAFYPELRAYMRTYHPIPCLQKDDYCKTNLQDAPRIKTMLKSCQLVYECNNEPTSLADIASRSALGYRPPTTVVNLIFELFNSEPYVSAKYFSEGFVLHDLFSPTTIPTKLRAYAFLWLMHHFLEDPSSVTDFEVDSKVQAFQLARMEDIQPSSMIGDMDENIDSEEELNWGREMQSYRLDFLKKWRGEEGIGFAEDLANGKFSTFAEDPELTKKQKILLQNFVQIVESDDRNQSNPGAVNSQQVSGTNHAAFLTGLGVTKSDQPLNSTEKEPSMNGPKPKTVAKTRMTHIERLQNAMDAMTKYGDDSDLCEPEDSLSIVQLAWRRSQNDVEQGRDENYNSDDPDCPIAFPDWKPKEILNRLLGFAFEIKVSEPVKEDERKDKVIRYVGLKKSIGRTNQSSKCTSNNGSLALGLAKIESQNPTTSKSLIISSSLPPSSNINNSNSNSNTPSSTAKLKRKRKIATSNSSSFNHEESISKQKVLASGVQSNAGTGIDHDKNSSWQKNPLISGNPTNNFHHNRSQNSNNN
ncbi:hypothetical protein BY996DRAFT_6800927 [Phakopsora pachyrhizi]|uniref:Ino eighty subunit 1 n=1 Tax=Phakopsora pachyrhizi TaxID=170000 RepID=A0AAV0BQ27_PHAPC|nr:hypothetical protein BY996DRAFT_6800927 [Phakopsora pachyrhizi]CAH7688144.1 hypothetical protein PPACK8108_LOCUS23060 [Phakopsora pachyrhizi]